MSSTTSPGQRCVELGLLCVLGFRSQPTASQRAALSAFRRSPHDNSSLKHCFRPRSEEAKNLVRKLLKYQPFDRATAVQAWHQSRGSLALQYWQLQSPWHDVSQRQVWLRDAVPCASRTRAGQARSHAWFQYAAPFLRHAIPVQPSMVSV